MEVEEYLGRSRLYRRLRSEPHGRLVECYAVRLVEERLVRHGAWRCLNVVGGLLSWIAGRRYKLIDLDEQVVERYLRHRGGRQSIQPGDRAALKRWLSVLREEGAIASLVLPPLTPHERIFKEFDAYLRSERGLAPRSIVRHLPVIRRFLHEVCSGGAAALCKINQEDVIRYIERHAQDWSPGTGKAMCWSLRAFLRYLHHRGLNARPLADCVPSMRRWKLATLPTYLPAAQVRKALDGCDRKTVMGRRDYAILLLLAKLGLRADEVATLTLDDIDWRASEILVRARADSVHGCRYRQTLARPSLHICAVAAQSRRADGCSFAHSRRTSGLLPDVRSP
jgi:integrase